MITTTAMHLHKVLYFRGLIISVLITAKFTKRIKNLALFLFIFSGYDLIASYKICPPSFKYVGSDTKTNLRQNHVFK